MRLAACIFFLGTAGNSLTARGEAAWTYVPASPASRPLETYRVAEAPMDGVVTLVTSDSRTPHRHPEPPRVFAVDLPLPPREAATRLLPARMPVSIPAGARWPDSTGRIGAVPPSAAGASKGPRNPWEVRNLKSAVGVETVFLCGGILAGGDAGPIAILNGHVVRQGDAMGRFGVSRVFAAGVVLERNGSYYVVPRGTRTIITAVDG